MLTEFRDFGHKLYDAVPVEYRYLLRDSVYEEAPMSKYRPGKWEYQENIP